MMNKSLLNLNAYCFITLISLIVFALSNNQYYLSNPVYSDDGTQFSGILNFKGNFSNTSYHYDWTRGSDLLIPIEILNIRISLECNYYLHIYISDAVQERWENPFSISDSYKKKVKYCSKQTPTKNLSEYGLYISENFDKPFYISLTNPNTGELIFTTENTDFLFTDIFIGFAGYFTTNDVYGFGERYHKLKLGDGKFTMWPNDTGGIHEDTGEGGYNAMGMQPLGLHRTKKNSFVGLIFNNINAQDLFIKTEESKNNLDNNVLIEHRTIGGVIDYYLTINTSPDEALVSMHDIIGHTFLPPYWSLGFHQCRYGYKNTLEIRNIYENYMSHEIPIDTFWGDIDTLQDFRIFTLNYENFRDLPSLITEMHSHNYKYINIIDLGFPKNDTDEFYRKGLELDAFIKSNYTKDNLISYVWPKEAVFPDFFSEEAQILWDYGLQRYYDTVKFDGIWFDMNEPAMLRVDDIRRGEILPEGYSFDPEKNQFENIPYIPGYRDDHFSISSRTLSENCYSKLYPENKFLLGYNFKPLIPFLENKVTYEILLKHHNKRPFILSRSTLTAQGRYSAHWLGDNISTYKDMKNGINGIYQFQIYGITMTGDDICGFGNDTWDTLCARWIVLGAFFPFSRNHNAINNRAQDPFAFGPNSKTLPSFKLALNMRYSLLRYFYTEIFKVSLGEKGSFFKPLFFNYFSDSSTYVNMDESVMIGDAFVLFPVFQDETNDIEVYLPKDDWSIYPSGEIVRNKKDESGMITLSGEFDKIHLFMRGGSIFPYQETFKKYIPNTFYLNKERTELFIIPDSEDHLASGDLIFDNDEPYTLSTNKYCYIKMMFIYDTIYFENRQTTDDRYQNNDAYVSKLKFFRMEYLNHEFTKVKVYLRNGDIFNVDINYISDDKLEIDLSSLNIQYFEIERIEFNND